ncbi:hypothetical protein ACFQY9_28535 [Microvirga aerilata]|uniref:hypothetical protein n=1 Tax=Microvirga aerilata TaxID=670292 RepID=UPI00363A14F4
MVSAGPSRHIIQEGNTGEWKTIYEDEVEERWVTVKVHESESDKDGDEGPAVRVTAAPIEGDLEQNGDGPAPFAGSKSADNSVTLEPNPVEDLKEELIEIGFSPVAAWIVSNVPA